MTKQIELKFIAVDKIHVDTNYQRQIDPKRVKKLAAAFDRGACKAVSLSRRADGTLWAYDGQHTIEIFKARGYFQVPAVIVDGTAKQEAEWFNLINGSGPRKATPSEKQKAGYFSGDSLAVEAQDMLDEYGIFMATGGTHAGMTRSIDFIKTCIKADKPRLVSAMDMIDRLWTNEREAWSRTIMRGAYEVAGMGCIDRLEAGLSKNKITPRRVLDVVQGMQLATGERGGGMGFVKKAMLALAQVAV